MEEKFEDSVEDVKYTDSQNSVATSNVYSMDFTDCSSDKNNSSSKETYVIEWEDSEDSEFFPLHGNMSVINLSDKQIEKAKPLIQINRNVHLQSGSKNSIGKPVNTNHSKYSIVAQETFTQTSKTIMELAETEGAVRRITDNKSLETQTSFISITENKTVEYRIEVSGSHKHFTRSEIVNNCTKNIGDDYNLIREQMFNNSLEDGSSKFPVSETENERCEDNTSDTSSGDKIIQILTEDSKENVFSNVHNECQYENTSELGESSCSDIEEDSLMECQQPSTDNFVTQNDSIEIPKSVDREVEELYTKLSENMNMHPIERSELGKWRFDALTPLTEESTVKRDSFMDITPDIKNITSPIEQDKDVLFTNEAGIKVKLLPKEDIKGNNPFKLPPIQINPSCPNSPHLNFLFSVNPSSRMHCNSEVLPYLFEDQRERFIDRWEIGTKDLASGESPHISERHDVVHILNDIQLPPIHVEGHTLNHNQMDFIMSDEIDQITRESRHDSISIKNKIKDLKMPKTSKTWSRKYSMSRSDSRSNSPSTASPDESRLCDAAERGCEALCVELLKRLRSSSWFEVADTLKELPGVFDKFCGVVTEHRIADLIRQVITHVESPRTQVARIACNALGYILKNTNYTKKPDFYEAVTILLTKTGSFSRPVRRAANVALDDIVCGVELTHAVSALCVHGISHKSGLVRCAAARLLVVCCALGGGGRELLRARPATAVTARRHTLRALAALLEDKNNDARKYAERLYCMLRPLANFEAYYLTDVDVELASRQMKKYDQLLLCSQHKETT